MRPGNYPTIAGTFALALALAGCSAPSSFVEISYEYQDKTETVVFHPKDIDCNGSGASSLSFPDKPFSLISLSKGFGSEGMVSAWINGDKLVLFRGTATIREVTSDEGATTYTFESDGEVFRTDAVDHNVVREEAVENAEKLEGTITGRLECATVTD